MLQVWPEAPGPGDSQVSEVPVKELGSETGAGGSAAATEARAEPPAPPYPNLNADVLQSDTCVSAMSQRPSFQGRSADSQAQRHGGRRRRSSCPRRDVGMEEQAGAKPVHHTTPTCVDLGRVPSEMSQAEKDGRQTVSRTCGTWKANEQTNRHSRK